jgi:hypothetical protein
MHVHACMHVLTYLCFVLVYVYVYVRNIYVRSQKCVVLCQEQGKHFTLKSAERL